MIGLVDGDIIAYELAFAAEAFWKHLHREQGKEPEQPPPFDIVQEMIDRRLPEIMDEAGCTEAELCFTGKGNFRNFIAITYPYKDRDSVRPFHYKNIYATLKTMYKYHMIDGLEADDLIGILMTFKPGKYICITRDKDLRQVPGWHYGWELGNQPSFGPREFDKWGAIELVRKKSGSKIVGGGDKFFFTQLLTGDPVDTVPGIPNMGPVTAYELIEPCNTPADALSVCQEQYNKAYGLYGCTVMTEQARLLYIPRQYKDGKVKLWCDNWIDIKTGQFSEEN